MFAPYSQMIHEEKKKQEIKQSKYGKIVIIGE